ncbi:MAG: hypothetical protein ACRYG7_48585 [Janthinobacterium lividum]
MSSKLDIMVAYYEAERSTITALLAECVAETDYKRAHLYQKTLALVSQQLQILGNIKNKWHDEKEKNIRRIEMLEARSVVAATDAMQQYYAELIAVEKEKLVELAHLSAQNNPVGKVFHATLSKLLAGKITKFILVLNHSARLNCHVRLVRKTVILSLPEIHRHVASHTLCKKQLKQFKYLGFRLYDSKDKLMFFAPYTTPEELNAVKCILARVAFEILYFKGLAGETFITYTEPATPAS